VASVLVAFAEDQTIVADPDTTREITTDPVALGSNDRASMTALISVLQGPGVPTLALVAQVSIDGVHWVNQGPSVVAVIAAGPLPLVKASVNGAFLRFLFRLVGGTGSVLSVATFDVHVRLDKASSASCGGCGTDVPCAGCAGKADEDEVVRPEPFSGSVAMTTAGGSGTGGIAFGAAEPWVRPAAAPALPFEQPTQFAEVPGDSREPYGVHTPIRSLSGQVVFRNGVSTIAYPDVFTDAARTRKIPYADLAAADAAMMSPERAPLAALSPPKVPAAVPLPGWVPAAPPTPTTLAGGFGSLNPNAAPPGGPRALTRDPLLKVVGP